MTFNVLNVRFREKNWNETLIVINHGIERDLGNVRTGEDEILKMSGIPESIRDPESVRESRKWQGFPKISGIPSQA